MKKINLIEFLAEGCVCPSEYCYDCPLNEKLIIYKGANKEEFSACYLLNKLYTNCEDSIKRKKRE